jgi:hypothetical protein
MTYSVLQDDRPAHQQHCALAFHLVHCLSLEQDERAAKSELLFRDLCRSVCQRKTGKERDLKDPLNMIEVISELCPSKALTKCISFTIFVSPSCDQDALFHSILF